MVWHGIVHSVEYMCKMKSQPFKENIHVKQINIYCSIKQASKPKGENIWDIKIDLCSYLKLEFDDP